MALQTKTVSTGDYAWHSWSNGYMLSLTLTEQSVDMQNNTSQVFYLFTISNTDNNRVWSGDYSWSISIGGQSIPVEEFCFDLRENFTTQTIATGTLTVPHKADGTLDMSYSVSVPDVQSQNRYGPPAMTLSGTWTLTQIPRAASVSCPSGIIGQSVDITVGATDESFTYTLVYSFGENSGVIAQQTSQTVIPWVLPDVLYSQIPNERKGKGTITCITYSGNQQVGYKSCTFYASANPDICTPVISGNILDINPATVALTGDANVLVRYCSTAEVIGSCIPYNGATTESLTVTYNGNTYEEFPLRLYWVEKGAFRFEAKDSRDYKATLTVTKEVIPYIKLTCALANTQPDGDGNMTLKVSGNYFNGAFGTQSNTLTVHYRYKESSGSYGDWVEMPVTLGARTYNAVTELTGLDYKKSYTFQAYAADKLATVTSVEYTARATPVFDWDENDFNVNGIFKINNQPVVDYIVSQGISGKWLYRKWDSGIIECWGSGISATDSVVRFPLGFTEQPAVSVFLNPVQSPYDDQMVYLQRMRYLKIDQQTLFDGVELTYCKTEAASLAAAEVTLYVIGRWK